MFRSLLVAALALFLLPHPANGWSGSTHICTAELIREDVIQDGAIDIREVVKGPDGKITHHLIGTIPIRPELVAAIRERPLDFHAGSCSADAYPDMYVGQSVIHPWVPGQPWRATDWARQVVRCAAAYGKAGSDERKKAEAFAAGWLIHYAGDAFGHTHVNHYAGGAWDWGDMDIVLKHVAYESYINTKIPGAADPTLRRLDADAVFIRDALMLDERAWDAISGVSYMKALVDYYHAFAAAVDSIDDTIHAISTGGGLFDVGDFVDDIVGGVTGLDIMRSFCAEQRDNSFRALMEWGETSTRVIRYMTEGKPLDAVSAVSQWAGAWTPHLLAFVPNGAEEVADYLGAPIGWIMDPVRDLLEQTLAYIWEHVIQSTFERIVNPVEFMREMHGEEVMAEVDALMGVAPDHPELDPETFAPFHDTLVLGKLALLDGAGLKELGRLLGAEIPVPTSDDNVLWDCIESLDASNQLYLYPVFRLLSRPELTEKVYRRLFLTPPMEQGVSAIDPAHLLLWPRNGLSFGTPVADPGATGHRVVGYVLKSEGGQGALVRRPVYAAEIPTAGGAGGWTAPVWGGYQPDKLGLCFIHLATSAPAEGGGDPVEDRGVDIVLDIVNLPGSGTPSADSTDRAAAIESMRKQIESLERALSQPGLPSAATDGIRQALAAARKALADLEGGGSGAPAGQTDEPWVFRPELLNDLERIWREGMEEDRGPVDPTVGMPAIGLVLGEDGEPVAGATVTLLTREIFDALRTARDVPGVPLHSWLGSKYFMGRTNSEGKYFFIALREGPHVLVASAPGRPKTEMAVDVTYGTYHGLFLPEIRLTGALDPVTAAASQPGGALEPPGFGQHVAVPGLFARLERGALGPDSLGPDGTARLAVRLRPIDGLKEPVTLAVDGLPEGVDATVPESPVRLDGPRTVEIRLRGVADDVARCRVVAQAGEIVVEMPFYLDLTRASLEFEEREITIARGETKTLRFGLATPSGHGRAALVRLPALPPGVTAKVVRLRPHAFSPELAVDSLTPETLAAGREERRIGFGFPEPEKDGEGKKKEHETPPDVLKHAPELLARGALLLAPGGAVEFALGASPEAKAGVYELAVEIRRGTAVTTEKLVLEVKE